MQRLNSLQGSWKSQRIPFIIILSVVAADQLSKLWIRASLLLGESLPEEGVLRLTHVANKGVVFGISLPQFLALVLPIIVVIAILFLSYRYTIFSSRLTKIGLGLVVGGSIGNTVDRFRLGHVTDFIDLRLWGDFHWPVFNVADSAIFVGVILIIFSLLHLAKSPGYGNGNKQNPPLCSR
jgi:signal peptidase II